MSTFKNMEEGGSIIYLFGVGLYLLYRLGRFAQHKYDKWIFRYKRKLFIQKRLSMAS